MFTGVGGLTRGLIDVGLKVVAGFDIDKTCRYAYEENNKIVTIKGEAAGLFSGIITAKSNSFKDVTGKYVSYMKQKLSNKGKDKDYMQSAGTSYRDLDSIAKKRLLDNKAIIKNDSSAIEAK